MELYTSEMWSIVRHIEYANTFGVKNVASRVSLFTPTIYESLSGTEFLLLICVIVIMNLSHLIRHGSSVRLLCRTRKLSYICGQRTFY